MPALEPSHTNLRIHIIFAHPLETSFIGAAHARIVETLEAGGHLVDDLDLYAEKFDPVMSGTTLARYLDVPANASEVESYAARLRAAEALVLVFPIWFDGLPAILQGYFQRVFLPGVAIRVDEQGLFYPNLQHIQRLAAVCSYGESRKALKAKGDPPHRFVKHNIGALIAPGGPFEYVAHYDMNFTRKTRRDLFMKRVTRVFSRW